MKEKAFVSRANWRDKDALLWTNFSVKHSPLFMEAGQEDRASHVIRKHISLQNHYDTTLDCSNREQPICAVINSDQLFITELLVILAV